MYHFYSRLLFIVGIIIGIFLAIQFKPKNSTVSQNQASSFGLNQYQKWFQQKKLTRKFMLLDTVRYDVHPYRLESDYLYDKIHILCLILVRNQKNAVAARATWMQGCNSVQLVNVTVERRMMPVKRTKEDTSWAIMCKTLANLSSIPHWTLIVYDYTFVLVENLRMFLASLDPNDRHYLGHAVKYWGIVYNMGQAGYVLSRASLAALKDRLTVESCTSGLTYWNQEDYHLGKHMAALNISPSDTRDSRGLSTFHPYNLYQAFFPGSDHYKLSFYPYKCCSQYTIAFQSIEGDKMYTYHYLLYKLQIFYDGNLGNTPYRTTVPDEAVWKQFLLSRNISTNITDEQYYKAWEDLVDDPTSFARHMKREQNLDYD